MDTLVANISGKAREVRRNGKTYLVAPTTLITPGVLAGSQGPLNYTEDQNRKSEGSWDGMPLVLYHPTRNGTPVSANTDESERDEGKGLVIGEVRKDRVDPDGKLKAESWFDVERVKAADKTLHPGARVLPRLLKGIPIEVSTGLGTDSVPVKPGFDSRGRAYDREARNYRPDHLAVLPDQVGACSNHDGCGIFVNHRTPAWGAVTVDGWHDSSTLVVANNLSKLDTDTEIDNEEKEDEKSSCNCGGSCGPCRVGNAIARAAAILNASRDDGGRFSPEEEADKAEEEEEEQKAHEESLKGRKSKTSKGPSRIEGTKAGSAEALSKIAAQNILANGAEWNYVDRTSYWQTIVNAKPGQVHSKNTGHWKPVGSGTGKGEPHEAAQRGSMILTDRDRELGSSANLEYEATGKNPASWVQDEDKWERAKAAADKGGYSGEEYWAVVSHIYQKMGGGVGVANRDWTETRMTPARSTSENWQTSVPA